MEPKVFTLQNRGMSRDLSVSKTGDASAYENHNIRITASDHDTLLSVTNERGNREVSLGSLSIEGTLIGWNVLNNHIILFTHKNDTDRIYRIDYKSGTDQEFEGTLLVEDNLNFSTSNPIESVVYYESEDIQKIYWVDGRNVLRFMNFMASEDEREKWDSTYFDSNRAIAFGVTATIEKDNSGNTRPNGTVQYILTYFNNHGQESGYSWVSDLVYLSPVDRGGSGEETNNNNIILTFSNLDTRFTHFRVYSLTRTSLNGQTLAYIVYEGETSSEQVRVIDDASNDIAVDSDALLFLGSRGVHPGTMVHKDQHLFLGNLQSVGRSGMGSIKDAVKRNMFRSGSPESSCITFAYDDGIDYEDNPQHYSFSSQLKYTSSNITTFKGGEKYRFGIVLHLIDGSSTDAIWIGDKVNPLYPKIENGKIKKVIAKCTLPADVIAAIQMSGDYSTVQLVIAEATYADRSVKAQGIVNPTMFNVYDRYTNGLYSMSSWVSRPRGSDYAWKHFEPVKNSISSYGEIECNYWTTTKTINGVTVDAPPTPYYRIDTTTGKIADALDGMDTFTHTMQVFSIHYSQKVLQGLRWTVSAFIIKVFSLSDAAVYNAVIHPEDLVFGEFDITTGDSGQETYSKNLTLYDSNDNPLQDVTAKLFVWSGKQDDPLFTAAGPETIGYRLFVNLQDWMLNDIKISQPVDWDTFWSFMQIACAGSGARQKLVVVNKALGGDSYFDSIDEAFENTDQTYWEKIGDAQDENPAAYYKKHIMFVDENVLTLNSPEIEYEAVTVDNADNLKFRIVGVAKVSDTVSDYTVSAKHGRKSGENLIQTNFKESRPSGNLNGLISWPLWSENGLQERRVEEGEASEEYTPVEPIQDRTSYDYKWNSSIVSYWLHMWNHIGRIGYFIDTDESDYGELNSKTFANLRYCYETKYNNSGSGQISYNAGLRVFNQVASQYLSINIGEDKRYYNGIISTSLMPPGSHKYPINYSLSTPKTQGEYISSLAYLYSNQPIQLDYRSTPHAVVVLPTSGNTQTILPRLFGIDSEKYVVDSSNSILSNPFIPWKDGEDYKVNQGVFSLSTGDTFIQEGDKYFYIGEIYKDYSDYSDSDSRYGGSTEAAISGNRFVTAGKQYNIYDLPSSREIIANEGDTYFQRWDCLKTYPTEGAVNNVADIMSVMLETHINIDGRYDKQRGVRYLASYNWEEFGALNYAYSQRNNFYTRRVLNEDNNLDSYTSSITWTTEKHDSAQIDEWSHITLSSVLALDGDKGSCQALKRFQNNIFAFQDRGIAEILFNSRTQLSTTDGVPVEIANSGKVDGKNYISNKYGCINKWSIIDGKSGLFFLDNINKVYCSLDSKGITPISTQKNFDVWFRQLNNTKSWNPEEFCNVVSYYDRVHSDIYLVRKSDDDMSCVVYNELLGTFTSFFDYKEVPMMTNIEDRFISFKNDKLWLQNEGFYGNFFGRQYDFWTRYRVTPDPFGDKIWTNVEYRADWYQVLDSNMNSVVPEEYLISGDSYGQLSDTYKENETFSTMKIWNEYQTTGEISLARNDAYVDKAEKKFRIWRLTIPRALREGTNMHGLDRIRNPWIDILLKKTYSTLEQKKQLMQLHDIVIKYFE